MDINRENLIKTILKSVNMRFVITFQGTRLLQNHKIAFKMGCVVRMVVYSILPQADSGPNGHLEDAPSFKLNVFEPEFDATVKKERLSIDFC